MQSYCLLKLYSCKTTSGLYTLIDIQKLESILQYNTDIRRGLPPPRDLSELFAMNNCLSFLSLKTKVDPSGRWSVLVKRVRDESPPSLKRVIKCKPTPS